MQLAIDPGYRANLVAGKSKGKQDVPSDGTSTLAIGFISQNSNDGPIGALGVPWGAPDDLNTFLAMVNNVPSDWFWSAFSIGRNQMAYAAAAVLAKLWLPGAWYVFVGVAAGIAFAMITYREPTDAR